MFTEASSKGLRDCSKADGACADTAQIIQPLAATLEPPLCHGRAGGDAVGPALPRLYGGGYFLGRRKQALSSGGNVHGIRL